MHVIILHDRLNLYMKKKLLLFFLFCFLMLWLVVEVRAVYPVQPFLSPNLHRSATLPRYKQFNILVTKSAITGNHFFKYIWSGWRCIPKSGLIPSQSPFLGIVISGQIHMDLFFWVQNPMMNWNPKKSLQPYPVEISGNFDSSDQKKHKKINRFQPQRKKFDHFYQIVMFNPEALKKLIN